MSSPPLPVPDPDSLGYWTAAANGVLAIAHCKLCGKWQHPPTEVCRSCGGSLSFDEIRGPGTIFSFIVVRHQTVPGRRPPYVVAIVEYPNHDGIRLTGVVRAAADTVQIGMPVSAVLTPIGDSDLRAPEFVPVDHG
jgi:uncharacterized OB-fold protein